MRGVKRRLNISKVNPRLTKYARALRRNQTRAEDKFWQEVRARRLGGFKFKRQVPIGPYIADFVCADVKLIVELDGDQHAENIKYDERRTQFLESKGYTVIRYWNGDVFEGFDFLFDALLLKLQSL